MSSRLACTLLAVLATLLLVAPLARAEELTPELIRQEIEAYQAAQKDTFRVYWKRGPVLETGDKRFKMGFHGRIMADYYFTANVDDDLQAGIGGDINSGFLFRRAWLTVNGHAFKYVSYMAQYAFETQGLEGPGFLDVWVGLRSLEDCLGCWAPDVRIGHFQEPFGLSWLTSSKYFQLMAWPAPTTTFTPGYNSGVEVSNQWFGDRLTARVGFFGANSNLAGLHNWTEGQAVTGRVTFVPYSSGDCRAVHLGASCSYRWDTRVARFRSRADIDTGPAILDTGSFDADQTLLLDLEAAWVHDRFNIQAEWMMAQVNADTGTDPFFWGGYVQAGYMLFGAPCRSYSKKTGSFGQTKVCTPLLADGCRGRGAWELAARAAYVDLDDGDKQGGSVWDIVVGVNWYLNENARVMFNYVHFLGENVHGSRLAPNAEGAADLFGVRFQVYW